MNIQSTLDIVRVWKKVERREKSGEILYFHLKAMCHRADPNLGFPTV
jgi:hypothetical protein